MTDDDEVREVREVREAAFDAVEVMFEVARKQNTAAHARCEETPTLHAGFLYEAGERLLLALRAHPHLLDVDNLTDEQLKEAAFLWTFHHKDGTAEFLPAECRRELRRLASR